MKKKFVSSWIRSKQPRKQRKYRANAPKHIIHKFLGAKLSKELRQKYTKKTIPVRTGDTVKIARGQFKGRSGKVESVDRGNKERRNKDKILSSCFKCNHYYPKSG